MKTTLPFELFSKGTTPRYAVPDWTAEKTSSIVIEGVRVTGGVVGEVGGKAERAACGGCCQDGDVGVGGEKLILIGERGELLSSIVCDERKDIRKSGCDERLNQ